MARLLPRWLHLKHGGYYYVRDNRWRLLSRDYGAALAEYARIVGRPGSGVGKLVDRALADMRPGIATSTYAVYSICAERVTEAFAEFAPPQIRPVHVAQFLDDAKATPSMANTLRAFLLNVFNRAVRWGIIESNPARDIKPFPVRRHRDRYITAAEQAAIRAAATPTLQCLIDVAYLTGQRISDVLAMRLADIAPEGVFVRQRKTGARVLIEMTADLADAITRAKSLHGSVRGLTLFHKRDGSPLAYKTIYGHWRAACAAAGVADARFHDLRAAAATDAKAAGQDSRALLGHTTESAHAGYLRSREIVHARPVRARK